MGLSPVMPNPLAALQLTSSVLIRSRITARARLIHANSFVSTEYSPSLYITIIGIGVNRSQDVVGAVCLNAWIGL
jgi:hypothetical protein